MTLVRNFKTNTSLPNQIDVVWDQPLDFNNSTNEIIVTRTTSHYPVELFNTDFPTKATDPRPVEIFRGKVIVGLDESFISVSGLVLTDSSASFPTSPNLKGRLLRDSVGNVLRITNNTATTITLESAPVVGKYVVLADFPTTSRTAQTFENDIRTTASPGTVNNLIQLVNAGLLLTEFTKDELANLIFKDGDSNKFIIKSNTANTIYLYGTDTPVLGTGMGILDKFNSKAAKPYTDKFLTDIEADNRIGSGLLDNQFYYYTAFSIPSSVNVAQAEFANINSSLSTQAATISIKNRDWGTKLYKYWPGIFQELDTTEDLQDLMSVFAFQFSEIHALIETFRLQDTHSLYATALPALSEQTGLPTVGFSIGIDTLRRVSSDMLSAWKLKGSKEGIALFIKIITTWDITNGDGNVSGAITDFLPNIAALRFFDLNLGTTNTRLTQTDPFVSGGRFAKSLPGIVIPGFFSFRELVITVPNVALYTASSTGFSTASETTTMTDGTANFGANNSLVGNYLLPNQQEINDIFLITSNTNQTITVKGLINNKVVGNTYVVLSPLNTDRFIILNKLMPVYIPYGTLAGFQFTT